MEQATAALRSLFAPDHFNYAFLQNQDRHVHLHVIPRYAAERSFAGEVFTDPDYPAHYAVPSPIRRHAGGDGWAAAGSLSPRHAAPLSSPSPSHPDTGNVGA